MTNWGKIYHRKGRFTKDEIYDMFGRPPVNRSKIVHTINGERTSVNQLRLRVFWSSNFRCQACQAELTHFYQEAHANDPQVKYLLEFPPVDGTSGFKFHLNAYGINSYGHECMMTIDHIRPKAHGGSNRERNLTTLCSNCNGKKGADLNWLKDLPRNSQGILVPRPHLQNRE